MVVSDFGRDVLERGRVFRKNEHVLILCLKTLPSCMKYVAISIVESW